jgi:hypothetical protein
VSFDIPLQLALPGVTTRKTVGVLRVGARVLQALWFQRQHCRVLESEKMNKPLAITAVALGLAAAAPIGAALAQPVSVRIDGPEFGIRIGAPVPHVYVPAPVVVAPVPVYAPPPVIYVPPPRVIAPRPVFYPAPYYRVRYEDRHHHHGQFHRHWDAGYRH